MNREIFSGMGYGILFISLTVIGVVILAATLFLGVGLVESLADIVETIIPFFIAVLKYGFWFILLVVVPLGLTVKLKRAAGYLLLIFSYWIVISMWLLAFLVAYNLAGIVWLIIGIIFGGGIIPVGIIAAILSGEWGFILLMGVLFIVHAGATYLSAKYLDDASRLKERTNRYQSNLDS